MPRYRKKPIIVEAERFVPGEHTPKGVKRGDTMETMDQWQIHTRQGWVRVRPGDWIITTPDGERYPCAPDVFEQTYEPVEEEDA